MDLLTGYKQVHDNHPTFTANWFYSTNKHHQQKGNTTMSTLTISSLQCLTPSDGIGKGVKSMVQFAAGAISAAAAAAVTEGVGAIELGAEFSAGSAAAGAAVDWIGKNIGSKTADDVYLKIDGERVWGGKDGTKMNALDVKQLDITRPFEGSVELSLWEYDTFSGDDRLGKLTVTSDTASGEYLLYNTNEGDFYQLSLQVEP